MKASSLTVMVESGAGGGGGGGRSWGLGGRDGETPGLQRPQGRRTEEDKDGSLLGVQWSPSS